MTYNPKDDNDIRPIHTKHFNHSPPYDLHATSIMLIPLDLRSIHLQWHQQRHPNAECIPNRLRYRLLSIRL